MLNAQRLTREFGDLVAVDDVSFSVEQGEIVGLLGHNGAGKTTVMKLLTGYLEPNAGSAEVDGINVQDDPVGARARLGYLPENRPLYAEQTVAEYLWFSGSMRRLPEDQRLERLKGAIVDTELQDRFQDPIGTLSRGFQQRVGVAQAILHKPAVLILDEPTNGLDPTQTAHMRSLIKHLASQATVIISTHIMQEVEAICDRVLIMRDGKLVVDEKLDVLRSTSRIVLKSSAGEDTVSAALGSHVQVSSSGDEYVLTSIDEGLTLEQTIAKIVPVLVDADIPVFSIEPERRDLEVLFREVSEAADAT